MKRNYILQTLVLLFFVCTANAQQGINYKAIIKDGQGSAIINTGITVQFTILENGTTSVYQETHTPTTDANGIIIVNIGEGSVDDGVFNDIDWGSNPHFLKTEIDKGDGLTDMGTTEFKTVPYALYAETANMAIIDAVDDADADPSNELNTGVNLNGTTLEVTDAGGTKSANLSSLVLGGGDITSCDILLNLAIITEDAGNLFNAGVPLSDLVSAGATVSELIAAGATVLELIATGVTASDFYGAEYAGGLIFYIDITDGTGLVAAPNDQGTLPWGCVNTTMPGADGTAIGTGAQNTADIITGCTGDWNDFAAKICAEYTDGVYDDWFLPSKDELDSMYTNLKVNGFGSFMIPLFNDAAGYYWSSSQHASDYAWVQNFNVGNQYASAKAFICYVRAIRAF